MDNASLLKLYEKEYDYIVERSYKSCVLKKLHGMFIKNNKDECIMSEYVNTHDKNAFLVFYIMSKVGKDIYHYTMPYGITYDDNGKMQIYFKMDKYIYNKDVFKNKNINLNSLVIINEHVIDRFNERCNFNLDDKYKVLELFFYYLIVTTGMYDSATDELKLSCGAGLLLGTIDKDGTQILRTFVNNLYSNQKVQFELSRRNFNSVTIDRIQRDNKRLDFIETFKLK